MIRKLPLSTKALEDVAAGPMVPGGVFGRLIKMSARPSTTLLGTLTTICVSLALSGVPSISIPPWRKATTVPGPVPKLTPEMVIWPVTGSNAGAPMMVGEIGVTSGGVGTVTRMCESPTPLSMGMFIVSVLPAHVVHTAMLAAWKAIGKVIVLM